MITTVLIKTLVAIILGSLFFCFLMLFLLRLSGLRQGPKFELLLDKASNWLIVAIYAGLVLGFVYTVSWILAPL